MKYMLAAAFTLCFSLSAIASETNPPSGAPTDNCDKEITSLTAPCKPPVSVQLRSSEDGETSTNAVQCIVTAQGARICGSRKD